MKATFKITDGGGKFTTSHRKENHFYEEFTAIVNINGAYKTPVICRIYSTNTNVYCCIWVNGNNVHCSGSGVAGGYGYHKTSAAVQYAMSAAGIELDERIDGCGNDAIREAIYSIAETMGYESIYVHTANA